jgi:hypothetical protein
MGLRHVQTRAQLDEVAASRDLVELTQANNKILREIHEDLAAIARHIDHLAQIAERRATRGPE